MTICINFLDKIKIYTQFRQYEIDNDRQSGSIKFKYSDTMGLESDKGLTASDFGKIMDGHIMDMAEVSPFDWNLTL